MSHGGAGRMNNASGGQGAAAGAAYSNRNSSDYSGGQGAAAGYATSNRNSPDASGAQGAAAGAAYANRNSPDASGAQALPREPQLQIVIHLNIQGHRGDSGGICRLKSQLAQLFRRTGCGGRLCGRFFQRRTIGTLWHSHCCPRKFQQLWDLWSRLEHGSSGALGSRWLGANDAWRAATWNSAGAWCGYASAAPMYYDYGNNITYQDNEVYVNGQDSGSSSQYYDQAAALATTAPQAEAPSDGDWLPLGVFAFSKDGADSSNVTIQLAVNKQGVIRGNSTETSNQKTETVAGSVDKQTQRSRIHHWQRHENSRRNRPLQPDQRRSAGACSLWPGSHRTVAARETEERRDAARRNRNLIKPACSGTVFLSVHRDFPIITFIKNHSTKLYNYDPPRASPSHHRSSEESSIRIGGSFSPWC